ncbi:MAG: helix-turn-helix transcriptional regulator [Lachnospiraceae bacterium]
MAGRETKSVNHSKAAPAKGNAISGKAKDNVISGKANGNALPEKAKEGNKVKSQKHKFFVFKDIMLHKTDKEHALDMNQILDEMLQQGVSADRKLIYRYIQDMEQIGFPVEKYQSGRDIYYHVTKREFALAELKLLVDAIQSSKFITQKKSQELIQKIEKLTSDYEAQMLNRQVYVQGRIKSMNDSIYANVDFLHTAIAEECCIRFRYFTWNVKKRMQYRHDGKFYYVSPWALVWSDEYYYLVAYDNEAECIKHFRVDKIIDAEILPQKRKGKSIFKNNVGDYAKSHIGMFGGEQRKVTIQANNDKAGVIIDRFGKEIPIKQINEREFQAEVKVAVSSLFIGWIFGLGEGVRIVAPQDVVKRVKEEAERFYNQNNNFKYELTVK